MKNLIETSDVRTAPTQDTFKILIATDIHLGYAENDVERGDDSFNTFEEILQIGKSQAVDFILLGGDLFHDNKPSTECLHKCLALLRKYCLGDKPVEIDFVSDENLIFQHCSQKIVNYDDPNLNIAIPVFSIHGNHDDPSGSFQLCSLDILSASGLVNYFGKWTDLNEVQVLPLLFTKGSSKLALYGLSHIKDERLFRLFRDSKVCFNRPQEYHNDWFNIFVLHQNRAERGQTKYIPEEALPDFLDFVIWGHEHECRLQEEWNSVKEFYVTQPGSPVATSLCEGEAKPKHVGILHVFNKKFKLVPYPLKTVRPFIHETIILSQCQLPVTERNMSDNVQTYLDERINFNLMQSTSQITGHPKQPQLPLLRVRVEYRDEDHCFNSIRFGQRFISKVANPVDMILLKKEKLPVKREKNNLADYKEEMDEFLQNEEVDDVWEVKMNTIIEKYFNEVATNKKMQVLTIKGISEAAAAFIDKRCTNSISKIITHQMDKVKKYLINKNADIDNLNAEIEAFREERSRNAANEEREIKLKLNDDFSLPNNSTDPQPSHISDSDHEENDQNFNHTVTTVTRGSRGGRARGSRARGSTSTSRARGRGRASQVSSGTTTRASVQTTLNVQKKQKFSRLKYQDSDSD